MNAETILLILVSAIVAGMVSLFMYGYKTKYTGKLRWVFAALRFITLFSVLVLLVNPKFENTTYTIVKPNLPVLIDNSKSIQVLEQVENAKASIETLKNNEALNDKFNVSYYQFGTTFNRLDSLSFSEKNTNIATAFNEIASIYDSETAPVVLITDGNQTLGSDYEFATKTLNSPVYPVILGDDIAYTDLKITQLNTNRYAFLKNQFLVETVVVYNGDRSVTSQFTISQGSAILHRSTINFSALENSKTITVILPASTVGLQKLKAQISPLSDEKNTANNTKQFAVEVIDQATNVLVVSNLLHPDIGMLKKAITTNEQRTVTIKKPLEAVNVLNEYQLIILYQPDRNFSAVFQELNTLNKNSFVVAGGSTDWDFLNAAQSLYTKEVTNDTEQSSATLNANYGTFAVENLGFDDFPPLVNTFGQLAILAPNETLLEQTVNGIKSGNPMLSTIELEGARHAIWDAENIWKWRAQSYLKEQSFQPFDNFIGKLVQYLASNKRKSRLEVASETFYYNNDVIKISAQYFDKNYVFDNRASLMVSVVNIETEKREVFPLLLKNNFFEVDLNTLNAGEYTFTVSVKDEEVARSGSFTILDFDIEQQFLNANISKLSRLANKTNGQVFQSKNASDLVTLLINSDKYKAVQRSDKNVVPLIEWEILLGLIAFSLALEWFIRKYNGLI